SCGQECMYCAACLSMGRIRSCTPLATGVVARKKWSTWSTASNATRSLPELRTPSEGLAASTIPALHKWSLSKAQHDAVRVAVEFVDRMLSRKVGTDQGATVSDSSASFLI